MDTPLISEYKLSFIFRRLFQTFLGGPKLFLGFPAPWYIYVGQVSLYLLPWVLGALFTYIVEVHHFPLTIGMSLQGTVMFLAVFVLQVANSRRGQGTTVVEHKHLPLQDDDVIKIAEASRTEVCNFFFPVRRNVFECLFCAVVSAVANAFALSYLLPSCLEAFWGHRGIAFLIFIFGWVSFCSAQYSLTVSCPVEVAVFNPVGNGLLAPLHRLIYVLLLLAIHFISRLDKTFVTADGYFHLLFIFLPILWVLGILPPVDALFLWLFEQIHMFLFGGTALRGEIGDVVVLCLPVIQVVCVYFIQDWISVMMFAASTGFLLSINISCIFKRHCTACSSYPSVSCSHSRPKRVLFELGIYVFFAAMAVVIAYCPSMVRSVSTIDSSISYMFLLLESCIWLSSSFQRVYILGLFRNPFYPNASCPIDHFEKRKSPLIYFQYFRTVLLKILAPFLMIFYLSYCGLPRRSSLVIYCIAVVRSNRLIWQQTEHSLCDFTLISMYKLTDIAEDIAPDLPVMLLLVGFTRDRLVRIWNCFYVVTVLMVTSISQSKQRLRYGWLLIVMDVVLLPVVLGIMVLSSFLAAPLIPFLTLPIFLVGFPRPVKFWPGKTGGTSVEHRDSVYYHQAIPSFVHPFQKALSSGSFGCFSSGDFYLARFQDRLLWVQVIQCGFNYCKINVKGLELQETSCHTVEATKVDEILENAFLPEETNGSYLNKDFFNTLTPFDALAAYVYSDARNVLTGVIDAPDFSEHLQTIFPKVLLWVLMWDDVDRFNRRMAPPSIEKEDKKPKKPLVISGSKTCWDTHVNVTEKGTLVVADVEETSHLGSMISLWSDDDESDVLGEMPSIVPTRRVEIKSPISRHLSGSAVSRRSWCSIPGATEEDIIVTETEPNDRVSRTSNVVQEVPSGLPVVNSLLSMLSFEFGPPKTWFFVYETYRHLCNNTPDFPVEWFNCVKQSILQQEKLREELNNPSLFSIYKGVVKLCCLALNFTQRSKFRKEPDEVYQIYIGNLPETTVKDVISSDLFALLLRAYRYAVKLSLDEFLIGTESDNRDLLEQLKDYHDSWYLGSDREEDWSKSVSSRVPHLFSVGLNTTQNIYTSRLLTLQKLPVLVGKLNSAVIHGIWSTLAIELLYLTNDDDERYSIQAHPTILRNLTVQTASPPLGYPIFSSEFTCHLFP